MNVAQLKPAQARAGDVRAAAFPRLNERGSIEAYVRAGGFSGESQFPRLNERGSIEARSSLAR